MRRLVALALLLGGPLLWLARSRRPREHVALSYDDGSSVTLERGAPGSERLLALARGAL